MPQTYDPGLPPPTIRRNFVVGRIAGIEIALHGSWIAIALLLTVGFRFGVAPEIAPEGNGFVLMLMAVGMTLIFYSCVLAHELSHAIVARAYGLDARRVTLFFFGGVAQIGREAQDPSTEFRVALAGPLASLIISAVLTMVARLVNPGRDWFPGTWGVFAAINLALAGFNMLPGFPLDGGRILRSGLWAAMRDRAKATRWAGYGGKAVAFGCMIAGVVSLAVGRSPNAYPGLWGLLLGFFLYNLAERASDLEGGSEPGETAPHRRSVNLTPAEASEDRVTLPARPATLSADEGHAAPSDARRGRSGTETGSRPAGASADQPRERPGHPRR